MLTDGISFITGSSATNFAVDSGSSFPTDSNSVGELFYLTSGEVGLYVFNGTTWSPTTTGEVNFDGLNVKAAVRVATTTNISLSGTSAIDGVTLAPGDRVLVKNQSATNNNGIYIVSEGGWARAADFDNSPEIEVRAGDFVFVTEGQTQADTGWVLTNNGTIIIGSTGLTFAQFTGNGVTSVAASGGTTGLTFTGSPITSTGTLTLAGTLALANGGTGATTQQGAANAILPSQAGSAGLFLTTNGTNVS